MLLFVLGTSCRKGALMKIDEKTWKYGYAEVNGTKLYYELAGSGDAIVFIHGGYCDLRGWDDQVDAFAKHYKVLRYDLRGYGKSAVPIPNQRYTHHDDLKSLFEYLGISKAHLCGASFGSAIAVDFALSYPEMCLSLIPVGPYAFGYRSPSTEKLSSILGRIDSVFVKQGKTAAINYICENPFFQMEPHTAKHCKEIGYEYSFWHHQNEDPADYVFPRAMKQIDKINLPTLIITANNDIEVCQEIADVMAQKIPGSQKIIIADGGHDINMNKPAEFNKTVLNFLDTMNKN